MNEDDELLTILKKVRKGEISPIDAKKMINLLTIEKVGKHSMIDLNRQARSGIPEVVLAEWKSPEHLHEIVTRFVEKKAFAFITRIKNDQFTIIENIVSEHSLNWERGTRSVIIYDSKRYTFPIPTVNIGILSGGTSDQPIVEEAMYMARLMGVHPLVYQDVGIAGVHRLFNPLQEIIEHDAKCIIVIAGMEGALPSLVASLVNIPVIGVPASIGYGYGGNGKAALMSMLQSCVPGLVVVNIDNGVNAGATAALIALQSIQKKENREKEE